MNKVPYTTRLAECNLHEAPAILQKAMAEYANIITKAAGQIYTLDMPIFLAALELAAASLRGQLTESGRMAADEIKSITTAAIIIGKK